MLCYEREIVVCYMGLIVRRGREGVRMYLGGVFGVDREVALVAALEERQSFYAMSCSRARRETVETERVRKESKQFIH